MTGGRGAPLPLLLCPIHVVVCLARAVREWLPCMEVQDFKADSRDDVRPTTECRKDKCEWLLARSFSLCLELRAALRAQHFFVASKGQKRMK